MYAAITIFVENEETFTTFPIHASKNWVFSITGEGGGLPIMENSIKKMCFLIETFPKQKPNIFYFELGCRKFTKRNKLF